MRVQGRHPALEREGRSDAELLALIAKAQREALGQLYVRHAVAVRATARRITGDAGAAEDLVHDVFLEIWRNAGDYEPERGSVRTWLLVRTRSRSFDYRRRSSRPPADATWQDGGHCVIPVSAEQLTVRSAVTRLPGKLRELLELGYYAGMSSAEMALVLKLPLGTVKSRVARALSELRAALDDGAPGG